MLDPAGVSERPSLSLCGQQGSPVGSISTLDDTRGGLDPSEQEIELSDPGEEEEEGEVRRNRAGTPPGAAEEHPEMTAPRQRPPDAQDFHMELLGGEEKSRRSADPQDRGPAEKEDEGAETAVEVDSGTQVGPTSGSNKWVQQVGTWRSVAMVYE